jgi:hypothetical protein
LRYTISIWLFALFAFQGYAQHNFQEGEVLEYVLHFGPINAGKATGTLTSTTIDGKKVFHSEMLAKSTGLADVLYKVRDIYGSHFDPVTLLPLKSNRDISEGKYKRKDEVIYDHSSGKAYSPSGEHEVPKDIRDMLSLLYYVRSLDFDTIQVGEIIKINTFFDDELFPFDIRYRGKEKVKVKMGEFNCLKLVPFVEPGRIFESEDDMTIWISDDANKVPVRVKFDLMVGSIKCDLTGYSGLKY